jgi:hypothetical protein
VEAELQQNATRGKAPYPKHPFLEVPDAANFVAMARMRQQYADRSDQGDAGDIIIGTTALSYGWRLYSSDVFLVEAVINAGGSAELVL